MFRKLPVNPLAIIAFGFALVFVVLAIIGGIRGYSAVPYWDMWDGYLGFYLGTNSADFSIWWAQHNEHRIVLSRILFWIDLTFFQGRSVFLVVANYLLLATVAAILIAAWRARSGEKFSVVGFFLIAWLFSWIQYENLVGAFQSPFILAQLLPLVALYLMHKSVQKEEYSLRYFLAAALFGLMALGTMSNGVLALPMLVLFAVVVRIDWQRTVVLISLSVLGIVAYFSNFHSISNHGSLGTAIMEHPWGLFKYVLSYIGGPFYYFVGEGSFGMLVAKAAGATLILISAILAWYYLRKPRQFTLELSLILFILYIGGTAVGTGGGRMIFGVEQAFASRYMTPALMAWAALVVLIALLLRNSRLRYQIMNVVLIVVLIMMLPYQLKAKESKYAHNFDKKVAALALELGVNDPSRLKVLYPDTERVLVLAEAPVQQNLSIFGIKPLMDLRERLNNQSNASIPDRECLGKIEETNVLAEDPRFIYVKGWIADSADSEQPKILNFLDQNNRYVGFAVHGRSASEDSSIINFTAEYSGFAGYVQAQQYNAIFITAPNMNCRLTTSVSVLQAGEHKK